tara:strand:+ start:137 stop:1471 length:1335 start_codon:yes stop_codon:yes gene_type:complete
MPDPTLDSLKEIALGELNDDSFDMESPLITNELNGKSLLSLLMDKVVERKNVFDIKKPHKGVVLLSTSVLTAGISDPRTRRNAVRTGRVSEEDATPVFRNFAIIRVPEHHAHIPSPNMRLLLEATESDPASRAQLETEDKLLLSMHDGFFSSPTNLDDMPQLKAGDIILLDGDGLIIKCVEPATTDTSFFGRVRTGLQGAFDRAQAAVLGEVAPAPIEGACEFIENMKRSSLNRFSDEFLTGLLANAQAESGLRATAEGDRRDDVGGNGQYSIDDGSGNRNCSFGYWQLNICAATSPKQPPTGARTDSGGRGFVNWYNANHALQLVLDNGNTGVNPNLYSAIRNSDTQFEFMADWMEKTMTWADPKASQITMSPTTNPAGITGPAFADGQVVQGEDLAYYWGAHIAHYFEGCAGCLDINKESSVKRGKSGKNYYKDGTHNGCTS